MTAGLRPDHGRSAVCPIALALEGGGPPAARRLLETFWHRVAIASGTLPGPVGAWLHLVGGAMAPVIDVMRHAGAALQPWVGSIGVDPLRGILTELLDPAVFSRPGAPTGAVAVQERVNEITFGSPLRGELRTLAIAQALLADLLHLPPPLARLRDARLHMIGAEAAFQAMPGGSRQDPSWAFLSEMHELGFKTAALWLADNLQAVGACSSLDLSLFAEAVGNTSTGTRAA